MTLITVEEQETALQPLFAELGVGCQVDRPDAVQVRELPLVILSPLEATYDRDTYGANSLLVRRQWRARLLVVDAETRREYQAEQAVKPFLTILPAFLASHPRVELEDGRAFQVELHNGRDTGVQKIPYGDHDYGGTEVYFYTLVEDLVDPEDEF